MKHLLKKTFNVFLLLIGIFFLSSNLCWGQIKHEGSVYISGPGGNGWAELRTRHINGKNYGNNGYDHLWINNNTGKNVFIGNINKASNLTVFGKLGARKVRVTTTGWADYVFKKEYNLPTLQEVEQHIQTHGHLKDIPSAAGVKKDGIDLGAMDAKLLAKIEELTLYAIQQQKEIQQLRKDLEKLIKTKN